MENENNINFLLQAALKLPLECRTGKLLKAYYRTLARRITPYNSVASGKSACPRCSLFWHESGFTLQFKSRRVRTTRAKNLVKNFELGNKLSRKQKIRAKWLVKKMTNSMAVTCNICKNITNVPFKRTKICKIDVGKPVEDVVKRKKKKKNIKTAGLKMDEKFYAMYPGNLEVQKMFESAILKSKTIKKCKNKYTQKSEKEKAISETQRKNTLLDLANVLKRGKTIANPNTVDRLKNLLR